MNANISAPGDHLRIWIPKNSDAGAAQPPTRYRGLAIPAVRDRVLQTSVAEALTPLAEHHAEDASFAYRRGRGVQHAVARLERLLREGWRWVVVADIEKFFDHIDHARLQAQLATLLPAEPGLLALIGPNLWQPAACTRARTKLAPCPMSDPATPGLPGPTAAYAPRFRPGAAIANA